MSKIDLDENKLRINRPGCTIPLLLLCVLLVAILLVEVVALLVHWRIL